jgi:hypothetical protein
MRKSFNVKMRKVANVKNKYPDVNRVMIHQYESGVYVYSFSSLDDSFCAWDEWYESVEEADKVCKKEYGIETEDWQIIDDPMEGCQGDWIAAVRIKGRNLGNPVWGKFERLENGVWKEFNPNEKN